MNTRFNIPDGCNGAYRKLNYVLDTKDEVQLNKAVRQLCVQNTHFNLTCVGDLRLNLKM